MQGLYGPITTEAENRIYLEAQLMEHETALREGHYFSDEEADQLRENIKSLKKELYRKGKKKK